MNVVIEIYKITSLESKNSMENTENIQLFQLSSMQANFNIQTTSCESNVRRQLEFIQKIYIWSSYVK